MKNRLTTVVILFAMLLVLAIGVGGAAADSTQTAEITSAEIQNIGNVLEPVGVTGSARYIVRLNDVPLALYNGGVEGFAATNAAARGQAKLDVKSADSVAYMGYLDAQRAVAIADAEAAIGRDLAVEFELRASMNGYIAVMTPAEAARIAALSQVNLVERERMFFTDTDNGPAWLGAEGIWDGTDTGGLPGTKGEGIIVGIIDTGIDPWNPSFLATGDDGYTHTNPGAGYLGVCDPTNTTPPAGVVAYDATFPCNDKLIGVWGYTASDASPRDLDGHGSHTASTSAGNVISNSVINSPTATFNAAISGVAPHANIIMYDGCGPAGCPGASLTAARDQLLLDGVDVVNYSIGSSSPTGDAWADAEAGQWLAIRAAGIFVATSAGNAGPGDETIGSPGDIPWIMTVGASSHNRAFLNSITLDDGTRAPLVLNGLSMTSGLAVPTEVVYSVDFAGGGISVEDARLCADGVFPPGTFTGQIVVCERGAYGRVAKGQTVFDGGAGGYILAQPDEFTGGPGSRLADPHVLPGVHIDFVTYQQLQAYMTAAPGTVNGTIAGTTQDIDDAHGDVMAAFSSRGSNRSLPDVIVPSITAPGRDIWAAYHQGTLGDGDFTWNVISGTSMSSPHTAGAGALMKALHPTWSAAEIQSAIMLTARTGVINDSGAPDLATPFAAGSGHVDLSKASRTGIIMNVTNAEYTAADPGIGGNPAQLNLASLGNGSCYQDCSWNRTFKNPTVTNMTWDATFEQVISKTSAPGDLAMAFTPSTVAINAGATAGMQFDIDVHEMAPEQWHFGKVVLTEQNDLAPAIHLPVAVYVSASDNSLVFLKEVSAVEVPMGNQLTYTMTLKNYAATSVAASVVDNIPANSTYTPGSATGGLSFNGGMNRVEWAGTIPAAPLGIVPEDIGGYLSMASIGAAPFSKPADTDGSCYGITLPGTFIYNGVPVTQVVWSINGTIEPTNSPAFCSAEINTNLPSAATPNSLLAAAWTDLDIGGAAQWYAVGGVPANGASFTVFEWENATGPDGTYTFQIWLEEGGDRSYFTYGNMPATMNTLTVGLEDAAGTAGATRYFNGTGIAPDSAVDLRAGLDVQVQEFTFQVDATGAPSSEILNEAVGVSGAVTVNSWAWARIEPVSTAVDLNNAQVETAAQTGWLIATMAVVTLSGLAFVWRRRLD